LTRRNREKFFAKTNTNDLIYENMGHRSLTINIEIRSSRRAKDHTVDLVAKNAT
jgi:hypothetical protein